MQRLREGQQVTLTPANADGYAGQRAAPVGCVLAMIEGPEAILVAGGHREPFPTDHCMLSFHHACQLVALKGRLKPGCPADEPHFRVSDGVQLPRREASRLEIDLPLRVVDERAGEPLQVRLRDLSSGGLRFELAGTLGLNERVTVSLTLPDGAAAIEVSALVVRHADDGVAVRFVSIRDADRTRIVDLVRARKLAIARGTSIGADPTDARALLAHA